ncbi:MAG: single-stranded DNA-binding protein [Dehalogenimonas sp.]
MASLNKVMIIGNVGGDPEMRFTPAGHPVTSFSVATNRTINTQGAEPKKETEWFNVVAWEKLAEQCNQFLAKGRLVYVEGRLQTRSWDGQDGQKHYKTEVIANRVMPLDKRQTATGEAVSGTEATGEISPDDIPF